MKVAIVNLGTIVTGDWQAPFAEGDTILMDERQDRISVGTASARSLKSLRRGDRRRRRHRDPRA